VDAAVAIRNAVEILSDHPMIGRRIQGEIRELVISYGKTGYVALYRFLPEQSVIRILAIRYQRELDFLG
jgi:plasmid stabilization system protein ParE